MDADEAIANAVRLLQAAEMEIDLAKMERLNGLGDSWLGVASLLAERESA